MKIMMMLFLSMVLSGCSIFDTSKPKAIQTPMSFSAGKEPNQHIYNISKGTYKAAALEVTLQMASHYGFNHCNANVNNYMAYISMPCWQKTIQELKSFSSDDEVENFIKDKFFEYYP